MREPDLVVGPPENPYLLRWTLVKWRGWQLALHHIMRDDDDRALHDHSDDNWSFLLTGCYWEVFSHNWEPARVRLRLPFIPYFRKGEQPHRLMLWRKRRVWTLWLRGPARREWGFWCPKGWRHWSQYVAQTGDYYTQRHSSVGKGCD